MYKIDYFTLEEYKEKLNKLYNRTLNYLTYRKTKNLIIENGCSNYELLEVTYTGEELNFYILDEHTKDIILFESLTIEDIHNKNYIFKYDRKYHTLTVKRCKTWDY